MPPRCRRCHRILRTPEAVEAGYGRVCYLKMFNRKLTGQERSPRANTAKKAPARVRAARPIGKADPIPPLFLEDIECRRNGDSIVTNVPHRIHCHSNGFEWGYAGNGPAELALNILSLFIGTKRAFPLQQKFKQEFIATLPYEGGIILREQILNWIDVQEQKKTAAPTDQSEATV